MANTTKQKRDDEEENEAGSPEEPESEEPESEKGSDDDFVSSDPKARDPKAPKAKRQKKAPVTAEERQEAVKEGDAYIDSLLKDEKDEDMLVVIISKNRSRNVEKMETLLLATGALEASRVMWIVGAGERDDYLKAGARGNVVEGGKLCASRNQGIDEARKAGCRYVLELSDDLKKMEVIRCGKELKNYHVASTWKKPANLQAQNKLGANKTQCSPHQAARLVTALMRATSAFLGGAPPTANPGIACGAVPVGATHFIVGDFSVVDVQGSDLRWDENISLKEDYDFTAQHLALHGKVARSNRILCTFEHYTNEGGAVDARTDAKEQHSIQLLHHKWPGAFRKHTRRGDNEVQFCWDQRDVSLGGTKTHKRQPPPEGVEAVKPVLVPGQKTLTSFFASNKAPAKPKAVKKK